MKARLTAGHRREESRSQLDALKKGPLRSSIDKKMGTDLLKIASLCHMGDLLEHVAHQGGNIDAYETSR